MNAATILKFKGSDVVTSPANRSLLHIAQLLTQHGIGCIVIVGEDEKIAGIVSERDLMRAIGQAGPKVLDRPVSDFMTKNVVTARKADTTELLMSEMTVHRFRHMPVVETARLIGLISIGDLVKIQIADMEVEATATGEYADARTELNRLGIDTEGKRSDELLNMARELRKNPAGPQSPTRRHRNAGAHRLASAATREKASQ